MKRLVILLFITSTCYGTWFVILAEGDIYTSHQKPNADSTLDIGTSSLLWRYVYGDAFTDGTALWENNSLSGFTSISGTTITDGSLSISGGAVRSGSWNAEEIDISSYTNLVAGLHLLLTDDTLSVTDSFLVNDEDDTTTGTLTAEGGIHAGGDDDYTDISEDGVVTFTGRARPERHIIIGSPSWSKGATAPTSSYEGVFATLIFADAQDDDAHYTAAVPFTWDTNANMKVSVHWQHDTVAKTGSVLWNVDYLAVEEGEDPAGGATTISQLSVGNHAASEIIITDFETRLLASNMARMDDLGLKLWRNGDDGSDDLTEGAELIAVHLHYRQNVLGDTDESLLLLETGDQLLYENTAEGSFILENI